MTFVELIDSRKNKVFGLIGSNIVRPDGSTISLSPTWSVYSNPYGTTRAMITLDGGEVCAVMASDKDGWVIIEDCGVLAERAKMETGKHFPDLYIGFGVVVVRDCEIFEHSGFEEAWFHQESLELYPVV